MGVQIVSLFPQTEKEFMKIQLYSIEVLDIFEKNEGVSIHNTTCKAYLWVDQRHVEGSSIGTKSSLPAFRFFFGTKQNIPIFTQYIVSVVVFPATKHCEKMNIRLC